MKKQILSLGVALLLSGWSVNVYALPTVFDFEGAGLPTNNDNVISNYMTGVYGSSVVASDVEVRNNLQGPPPAIPPAWIGNTSNWLITRGSAAAGGLDLEILFEDMAITALYGGVFDHGKYVSGTRGYLFDNNANPDFQIFAYDSTYGNVENPNASALVDHWIVNFGNAAGDGIEIILPDLLFSRPVSLLVFSDNGQLDIGVDNLTVAPVPEPATMLLFGSGLMALAGFRRKRKGNHQA